MQTTEQRLDQLEKRNKRLTVALTLMAVAMCAAVTMAATGEKDGVFDEVVARSIYVANDEGKYVVALESSIDGSGFVETMSAKNGIKKRLVQLTSMVDGEGMVVTYHPNGKKLVSLNATDSGKGSVTTYQPNGKELVDLSATVDGEGMVVTYHPNGKELVTLSASDDGGLVYVHNKTGEVIATMQTDEYGNGLVGAWNRKGRGRTLKPGP